MPASSVFHRTPANAEHISDVVEARAQYWLQLDWGKPIPTLYEQVARQRDGFAMILLWAEIAEEEDCRTSKERLRDRQASWRDRR